MAELHHLLVTFWILEDRYLLAYLLSNRWSN